ncbi:MAG: translation initiation factor IF-6 [Theionarchaea archaeon]|nr:translation initiation factor IF-6 [Theionarchaea archaeon]
MISKMDFEGIPFIGAYGFSTDLVTLIRINVGKNRKKVEEVLQTPVVEATIGKSILLGVFVAGNSSSLVVPYFIEDAEAALISEYTNVHVYPGKHTALGNLVLSNDRGCIISPELDRHFFQDALGTEVVNGTLGGFSTVGSVGVATNRAGLLHPTVTEDDVEFVEELLHIPCGTATANRGVGYIRLCMLANTYGAILGQLTTGPEVVHIEDILEG